MVVARLVECSRTSRGSSRDVVVSASYLGRRQTAFGCHPRHRRTSVSSTPIVYREGNVDASAMGNSRTPLNPDQRAVLERLESRIDDPDDGLSWETAVTHLATHDIEEAVARDRIEALLLKGTSTKSTARSEFRPVATSDRPTRVAQPIPRQTASPTRKHWSTRRSSTTSRVSTFRRRSPFGRASEWSVAAGCGDGDHPYAG